MERDEISASNRQWVDWAKRRAAGCSGAEIRELPGLTVAWSGGEVRLRNSIFLSRPVESASDFGERMDALAEFLRERTDPPFLVVCVDWVPVELRARAEEMLRAIGLPRQVRSVGMAAERLLPAGAEMPSLEYRRIADEETRRAAADINSAAWGFSLEAGRAAMGRESDWTDDMWGFVGYWNGVPVATCMTLALNGRIHVLRLATLPTMQRRRLGEAVMRRAVEAASAATGLTRTTLHATEAGDSLYRRMGYRAVAEFAGYGR